MERTSVYWRFMGKQSFNFHGSGVYQIAIEDLQATQKALGILGADRQLLVNEVSLTTVESIKTTKKALNPPQNYRFGNRCQKSPSILILICLV